MPFYEVHHICSLSEAQQDQLAEAITKIHSETFTTPRLFVNVRYVNVAQVNHYVGGKRRKCNMIMATVRNGGGRSKAMFDSTLKDINQAWASIVGDSGEKELRAIFLLGSIIGGSEAGFSIPQAGEDASWLKQHLQEFQVLAQKGDSEFKDMMDELKSRPAFAGLVH